MSALCSLKFPKLLYIDASEGKTCSARVESTNFAAGKRDKLHRLTRTWKWSGNGPNRSSETESHGRFGTGVLDKGTFLDLCCVLDSGDTILHAI